MSEVLDPIKVMIPNKLFFKIGEVAELAGLEPYVLRYWETEFNLKPSKSKKQQRLYQRKDIESILRIKKLLYEERYTIEGARKRLKELKKLKQGEQLTLLQDRPKAHAPSTPSAVAVPEAAFVAAPLVSSEQGLGRVAIERLLAQLLELKREILTPLS